METDWLETELIYTKVYGCVPLEGYFCPFWKWPLQQFVSNELVFLKKTADFPLSQFAGKTFPISKFYDVMIQFLVSNIFFHEQVNQVWAATNLSISRCGAVA